MNWISVKEKLPEEDCCMHWVLVFSNKSGPEDSYSLAFFRDGKWNVFNDEGVQDTGIYGFGDVTHWMSLPPKPKEQQ